MRFRFALVVLLGACATPRDGVREPAATSESEAKFGIETTFGSQELFDSYDKASVQIQNSFSESKVDEVLAVMKKKFDKMPKSERPRIEWPHVNWGGEKRYQVKVIFPDGWWFRFMPDPGVIEVNAEPMTLKELSKRKPFLKKYIFDSFKEAGLEPQLFAGAGHMHLSNPKLFSDALFFRNFIVDFFNHPGLASGALNDDKTNSIAFAALPERNKKIFREIIADFDKELPTLKKKDEPAAVRELASRILNEAYDVRGKDDPVFNKSFQGWDSRPDKNHALNIRNVFDSYVDGKAQTLEIRCIRPEASEEAVVALAALFQNRLSLIEQLKAPIAVGSLAVPASPQEVLADFHRYVTGAGLKFEDYKGFVMPWWQAPGDEWDRFLPQVRAPLPCAKALREILGK
jgi:hypothetical protein